jgi:hypothetical protein
VAAVVVAFLLSYLGQNARTRLCQRWKILRKKNAALRN